MPFLRRFLTRFPAVCLLFLSVSTVSAQDLPAPVADALRRAEISPYAVAVHVQEAEGGRALLRWNDQQPFSPASTMKLLTTGAALDLLGPAYTWKTTAYADGAWQGETLHGNLILKGSGDPKLVVEYFWSFLGRIRAAGIRHIRGDLVLDRSLYEDVPFDPAAFDDQPERPYNAGPDALLLNFRALTFRLAPDAVSGGVRASVAPALDAFPVVPPTLDGGQCGDWRRKLGLMLDGEGARFVGRYPAACGERALHVHAHAMPRNRYFELVFRRLWSELGGTFSGTVRDGVTPDAVRVVAEWRSPSLAEVIRDVNKYSNNVMARHLLLTVAAEKLGPPATSERGVAVVKAWLDARGVAAPELVVENGSGLSRLERMSALSMGQLLVAAFRSPLMPEFIASLPLAGHDGTMRKRLKDVGAFGHAHIKTGTLERVRAIAGYVQAASGKRYAVVCFINHENAAAGLEAQDALLQWVYERG